MILQKNGIDIPSYINHDFFKAVLKKMFQKSDPEIERIAFSMGSEAGDNYCSFIYRASVNVTVDKMKQDISLIIKSMPSNGERIMFAELQLHNKEKRVYMEMLPKLENLVKTRFAARLHYYLDEPIETLVFEDLTQLDYRVACRQTGLNEEHCAIVLKKLGEFHAASMVLAEKDPSLIEQYSSGLFNKKSFNLKFLANVFQGGFTTMLERVKTWKGYENICNKLECLQPDYLRKFSENADTSPNEIKVLNHGDLWVNNFMFNYSTGSSVHPTDVLFVDFQGCFYCSPGIDINYFLNTSVELSVLKHRRNYMLREYYYKSFMNTLEILRAEYIPTFEDIMAEVRRKEFYGFSAAVGLLGITGMNKELSKDSSIEALANDEIANELRLGASSSTRYQDMMRYMLERNDNLGLFG